MSIKNSTAALGLAFTTALGGCVTTQPSFNPNGYIVNQPDGSSIHVPPTTVPVQCSQSWADAAITNGNASGRPTGVSPRTCVDENTAQSSAKKQQSPAKQISSTVKDVNNAVRTIQSLQRTLDRF